MVLRRYRLGILSHMGIRGEKSDVLSSRTKQAHGLAAKGGFQCGQTAKARKDHRVQSLPIGTKPPSMLLFSQAKDKHLKENYHPVKPVTNCFRPPIRSHTSWNGSQIALSPEFARNSSIDGNRNQLVPAGVKLYGREK